MKEKVRCRADMREGSEKVIEPSFVKVKEVRPPFIDIRLSCVDIAPLLGELLPQLMTRFSFLPCRRQLIRRPIPRPHNIFQYWTDINLAPVLFFKHLFWKFVSKVECGRPIVGE